MAHQAPATTIKPLPSRKLTTLAITATRPLRDSRVQLVAWVAPLAKVPKTMVMAAEKVMVSCGITAASPLKPPTCCVAMYIDTISRINISGTDTRDSTSSPLKPISAVMLKPKPNRIISGVVKPSVRPSIFTSTMATVAVPQAYQPSSAKPSKKSDNRLPASPKQNRPINTVFRPLRAAISARAAAYRASRLLPMTAIHSMSTKLKAMPSLPPANIVPVKKVKLNNTMEMDSRPLRALRGASLNGNSSGELMLYSCASNG